MLLCLRDAALRAFTSPRPTTELTEMELGIISLALSIFAGQAGYLATKNDTNKTQDLPTPIGLPIDAPSQNVRTMGSIYNVDYEDSSRGVEQNAQVPTPHVQHVQNIPPVSQHDGWHDQSHVATEDIILADFPISGLAAMDWIMFSNDVTATGSAQPSWTWDPSWSDLIPESRHDDNVQFPW